MNTLVIFSSPDDNNCTTKWELPPVGTSFLKNGFVFMPEGPCVIYSNNLSLLPVSLLFFSPCLVRAPYVGMFRLRCSYLLLEGYVYGHMLRTNCYQAVALPSKHKTKITNNIFILIMLNIFTLCYSILLCRECSFDLQYDSAQDDLLHIFFSL